VYFKLFATSHKLRGYVFVQVGIVQGVINKTTISKNTPILAIFIQAVIYLPQLSLDHGIHRNKTQDS
jgi:hypothetical protein